MRAKDKPQTPERIGPEEIGPEDRPLLMVDIDGVISLFGSPPDGRGGLPLGLPGSPRGSDHERDRPEGVFQAIDGIPHFLSVQAAAHLLELRGSFDLVWASGWEEKANEYLPHLLGLPTLPFLSFAPEVGGTRQTRAHWKLDAIDAYAEDRPLAWIDDAFNQACHEWAQARPTPTLLVQTEPAIGLRQPEAERLAGWAQELVREPSSG